MAGKEAMVVSAEAVATPLSLLVLQIQLVATQAMVAEAETEGMVAPSLLVLPPSTLLLRRQRLVANSDLVAILAPSAPAIPPEAREQRARTANPERMGK
jgi:hypothetical protein